MDSIKSKENQMSQEIWRLPAVMQKTGLSRSTIYAFMNQGKFPKSIQLGPRLVGWTTTDINQWIEERIKKSTISHRRENQ